MNLGRLGTDGQLHVVGRCKDVVIRGGRNISPVEVELLMAQHPAVLAAACIGVPDPVLGELPLTAAGKVDKQALRARLSAGTTP